MLADGTTSPALAFLRDLRRGMWTSDPDAPSYPYDEQVSDHDKLLAMARLLANSGEPMYRRAVNDLQDGIWEFKIGSKRLSFFDTPGDGTYVPKYRIDDYRDADDPDSDHWWFPRFDHYIRLGHAFPKSGARTRPSDIISTMAVRDEDLAHDAAG